MNAVDPRLYLVLGPQDCTNSRSLTDTATAAVKGGATLVQLRDKTSSTRDFLHQAQALKQALQPYQVPLLINDRIDIALAAGAAGVHIGQTDMPPLLARELLGPTAIIGLTVQNQAQIDSAPVECLDYVSIGGVFATTSKHNPHPPIGLTGLATLAAQLKQRCRLPLTAIAGIQRDNLSEILQTGVNGVALISAITHAADPRAAAAELRRLIDNCLTNGSSS